MISATFFIDWAHENVTCPMGQQSQYWKPAKGPRGKPTMQGLFPQKACAACEGRARCTRSKTGPRALTLHPQAQHRAMQAAGNASRPRPFKNAPNAGPVSKGPCLRLSLRLGCDGHDIAASRKRLSIISPRPRQSICNALWIGWARCPGRKRPSHALPNYLWQLDSPTTSST